MDFGYGREVVRLTTRQRLRTFFLCPDGYRALCRACTQEPPVGGRSPWCGTGLKVSHLTSGTLGPFPQQAHRLPLSQQPFVVYVFMPERHQPRQFPATQPVDLDG